MLRVLGVRPPSYKHPVCRRAYQSSLYLPTGCPNTSYVSQRSQIVPRAHDTQAPGPATGPQRVFVFDASNSEQVKEVMVQPHADIEAAEEMYQQHVAETVASVEGEATAAGGWQSPLRAAASLLSRRSPIPLRAMSPVASRRGATPTAARSSALQPLRQQQQQALDSAPSPMALQKSAEMQKQLVAQLEREQSQVAHLQQFESLYREWRMKAERLEADMGQLQRLVAEKDAELAHGYKLLEASAAERSRLRHAFQAAQEKSKQLQAALGEAQQQALAAAAAPQGLLGAGSSGNGAERNSNVGSNGHGKQHTVAASVTVVQSALEELTSLAQGIAQDMSAEVRVLQGTEQQQQQQQQAVVAQAPRDAGQQQ